VGLALLHAILPKEQWLKDLGVDGEWAVWGVMGTILVDNAGEFRGVMLHRAAFEHGIDLAWRPVKTPQYGAHIERMMGTVAVELKRLPGATGANVGERGDYRPEKGAVLTLRELERWLTVFFIKEYHQRVNRGLGISPVTRWNDAVVGAGGCPATGLPPRPVDTETFRLDFLPCVERTIDIDTVVWDYIPYAADVLRSYARVRGSGPGVRYTFRRDPRDVSKLYFFAPDQKRYFEVPYRDRGRPPMTLWELRRTIESLRVKADTEIDAGAIFRARAERRAIVERAIRATRLTKKGRRDEERRRSAASARRTGADPANASMHASNIIPNTVTPDAREPGLPLGSPKIDKLYDVEQIAVVSPLRW